MADGNQIAGGGAYSRYDWHAYMSIWQVDSNDNQIKLHIELGYSTRWAINCYANGHIDQNNINWNGSVYSGSNSGWKSTAVASTEVWVNRTGSAWTYSCGGKIQVTGGFGNGTSYVTGTYTVPAHPYYTPDKPTNQKLASSTDTLQKLTVTLPQNYANWKDYTATYWYRHTDDGPTETIHNNGIINAISNSTSAGHKYTYDVRMMGKNGSLSDMSNVVTVFTSPNALAKVEVEKTAENKAKLTVLGKPKYVTGYEAQVTSDNGKTWGAVSLENWEHDKPPAGTVRYRVRSYIEKPKNGGGDTVFSPWTESNSITTICPPNAPSLDSTKPVYAANADGSALVTVSWVPNHPDGSAQTSAEVQVYSSAGVFAPVTIDGSKTTFAINVGIGTITVKVRTKGLDPDWGEWSELRSIRVAYAPQAWFTAPGEDMDEVGALPLAVKWDASDDTGISYQRIDLVNVSDGTTIASSEPAPDARSHSFGGYSTLLNNSQYRLVLTVRNGAGLTVTAERTFITNWYSPAAPKVEITYTDDLAAIIHASQAQGDYEVVDDALTGPIAATEDGLLLSGNLSIENGALKLSSAAPTKTFDLARVNPDGSITPIVTGENVDTMLLDRLVPLNTDFDYRITAHAETGTLITFNVQTRCDSDGDEAFNFGDAAETCLRVGYDTKASRTKKPSGTTFHFALGKGAPNLPTIYLDGDMDVDATHSYDIVSRELYDRIERLTDDIDNAVCYFRNAFGRVARVYVSSWGLGYEADHYNLWTFSPSITEVVWEEPLK